MPLGLNFEWHPRPPRTVHRHKGPIARLRRALAHFMLDVQTQEHGYTDATRPTLSMRKACAAPKV